MKSAVTEVTSCVATQEEETLQEWRDAGDWEIVEDVEIKAFSDKAVAYLEGAFEGDSLEVFNAIRSSAK